jgi:hypothetical protein
MRKNNGLKIKKNANRPESKFLVRKLSMTDRLKLKSVRSRNLIIKGQSRKTII